MKIEARLVNREERPVPLIAGEHVRQRIDGQHGLDVENAILRECDLSGQRMPFFAASGSTFEGCDFSRTRLDGGSLGHSKGAVFRDCRFARADLSRAEPGIARFVRCDFEGARLEGWFGSQAEFVDCRFSGQLRHVRFHGTVDPPEVAAIIGRERNEFAGNDFGAAELTDVEFVGGIDLRAQRLPIGPDYALIEQLPERLRLAENAVREWPGGEARTLALAELEVLRAVYRDQPAMFRRRNQTIPEFERIWQTVEAVELHT